MDWQSLPDDELARRGRDLVRHGHYSLAREVLSEYCSRMISQDQPVGADLMAAYGLAVGMTGEPLDGLATCQRALSVNRRNPDIWAAVARLALVCGVRKKAFEAVSRGLALAPNHGDLIKVQRALGVRRRPLLPFLPRGNPLNVRLGRLFARLTGGRKKLA